MTNDRLQMTNSRVTLGISPFPISHLSFVICHLSSSTWLSVIPNVFPAGTAAPFEKRSLIRHLNRDEIFRVVIRVQSPERIVPIPRVVVEPETVERGIEIVADKDGLKRGVDPSLIWMTVSGTVAKLGGCAPSDVDCLLR